MFYTLEAFFNHKGEYKGLQVYSDECLIIENKNRLLQDWYECINFIEEDIVERETKSYKLYLGDNFIDWFIDMNNSKYALFRFNKNGDMVKLKEKDYYRNLRTCFLGYNKWQSFDDADKFFKKHHIFLNDFNGFRISDI